MMNLEVNHANPEQSFFGAENDTALPEDMRALALENAKGRIEHLLQFVSGNPGQSSFSAHFILEDKFHNQMHSDFLTELEKHSIVVPKLGELQIASIMLFCTILLIARSRGLYLLNKLQIP